jgi:hypothetical protein
VRLSIGRVDARRAEGIGVVGGCREDLDGNLGESFGGEAPTPDDATKLIQSCCHQY